MAINYGILKLRTNLRSKFGRKYKSIIYGSVKVYGIGPRAPAQECLFFPKNKPLKNQLLILSALTERSQARLTRRQCVEIQNLKLFIFAYFYFFEITVQAKKERQSQNWTKNKRFIWRLFFYKESRLLQADFFQG